MSTSRRYIEPTPSVRVLDFAAGSEQDRFSPPKASIYFSPDGKRLFGVQDRPAVRVLRYGADAVAAAASAAAQDKQAAPPGGRRHSAFYLFRDTVRRNEQRWGLDTMQSHGVARSCAAVYKARLGGSEGVANCLVWHPDLELEEEQEEELDEDEEAVDGTHRRHRRCRAVVSQPGARPGTTPAASGASRSPTSLDMWVQAPHGATSPRFKARASFEQRRCATPDTDAIKRYGYLQLHKQRRSAEVAREAHEAELIGAWPHGVPRSELRRAQSSGLRVVGVGVGGNPLSMPRRTYLAMRPGMKWY